MKQGWKYVKLGEVCEILDSRRKPITKSKRETGNIPYYGATGLLDYVKDFIFDEPLVLLGEDGAKWGAGELSAYRINGKSWVNNHAHVLRPKRDITNDYWLIYFLNYSDLQEYIMGVTVPKLNQEKMRSITIPLPPLSEQESIVERLDSSFAKIDAVKANAEKSVAEAKALFQSALTEMMKPKQGWKEKAIEEIIDNMRTGLNPRTHFKLNTDDAIGYYITVRELSGFRFIVDDATDMINDTALKKINQRSNLKVGDVLFSGTGTLGRTAIVEEEPNLWNIKEGVYALTPKKEMILSKYLVYSFMSDVIMKKIQERTSGTTIRSIPMKELKKITIPLPPLSEQESIVERLDAMSEKVKALEENYNKTITECDAMKQAILREIFN